jgi:hypothetical protein
MPFIEFQVLWQGELKPFSCKQLYTEMALTADRIAAIARETLDNQNKNATGNLYRDVVWEMPLGDKGFTLTFPFKKSPYWNFVDKGVQGFASNAKAPNSPFKFGSGTGPKGKLIPAIDQWTISKGLPEIRDARGRFVPRQQMVKRIARSVYLYGIKPTYFISDPFAMLYTQAIPKLEKAFKLDVEDFLTKNMPEEMGVTFKISIG